MSSTPEPFDFDREPSAGAKRADLQFVPGERAKVSSSVVLADPSTAHLLIPKILTARARAVSGERGNTMRWIFLALFGLGFWSFIYFMLYRLLRYFRGVP